MKNIKIFAFLAIFLLSAFVSTAWATDVTLTYRIDVQGALKPEANIYDATNRRVASWDHGIKTLWPAGEGHTMNDDYKITFTPNRGLDKTGKNENGKKPSTTAFRTEENTTFTVSVGKKGFYFKSVTFKEDGIEKASSSNIIPNSTSIRVEVPENKFFNYITVVLTDDFHYSLSYDGNLTVSPSPSMTYNNVPYYAAGQTVTFGFSGSGSVEYFVNGVSIEGNSVTVRKNLDVQIGVPYIDENGKSQILEPGEYTVLTSTTDVSNLGGGWYVVQGKVEYTNQVKFSGDAHLILADGAEMVIKTEGQSEHGIYASNNLTIYGQNEQRGILNDTANGTNGSGIYSCFGDITISGGTVEATGSNRGIYGYEGVTISGGKVTATGEYYGIDGYKGVTINGGSVTATGTNGAGIYGDNGVTISGGKVTATGEDYGIDGYEEVTISGGTVEATSTNGSGIYSYKGNITISGGTVEASGSSYGIYSEKDNIILGWTNSTDFIYASGYSLGDNKKHVSIAEGKSFKDEDGDVYSGTLSSTQLDIIKKKTLEPCYAVTIDAQNGDDPIMLLTTFDENGVAHVAKPNDPIRSGFTFEGWFTATDGNTEFDFSAAITGNTTAYAKWSVPYIDEKGKPQIRKPGEYTVLTSLTDVSNLEGGWYVVQGEVSYEKTVTFSGDAHLILADEAKLEIKTEGQSEHGIYASNNLTIYGQNGQSGILNDTANGTGGYGIYSWNGSITISGGKVTATGSSYGIYSYFGDITINGGKVTATGSDSYGIYSYSGDITINGGTVEASGMHGICSYKGNIILGWTNSTDSIKASSYYSYKGSVQIAEDKSFKDDKDNVYRGTLNAGLLSSLKGQKLEPFEGVSVSFVDNFGGASEVIAEIAVDGEGHVSAPSKHLFHSGNTFVGWFTSPEGGSEFDFTVKVTGNTTAYAHWNENTPVEYIDENGKTKNTKNYILLTNDINVDNLPGGWYVVEGEVEYTNQVKFSGDAHLILADGAKMEIKTEGQSEHGIYASNNLTIYGQNGQSGILNDTANGTGGYGIYSEYGNITIIGGTVTATGKDFGIISDKGVTIIGGSVTASGSSDGISSFEEVTIIGGSVTSTGGNDGIYSYSGDITINGGTVTANGKYGNGIYTIAGHITLGWTNSTDFIKVSSIYLGADSCTVSIAEGKSFVDENGNEYRDTLTDENLESIKNKTLTPLMPFPDNIVIANISGATYTGDSIRPEPVVTIGENVLELDKDYTLAYKDNLNASDTAKVIVKGAGKYYGEVQKLFTIDKAPLKVTALNDTIVYGDEPANQGVAYDGFVGNETSEVLKDELALKIGYKQYDDAGKYAITPSGLTADNYEIEFVAGTLTVEPKVISIVWGEQTMFAYDGEAHAPTVTAKGFVEGHVASLVVTGAAVNAGKHTAMAAFDENDANSKNYKLPATGLEKEFKIVKPIAYIDENGVEQTVTDYTVLTENTSVDNLDGGWYVVEGEVKYTNQVMFSGDAHLILADGAKLEIKTEGKSEHGIYASNNLTIYGQNEQSGILNDTGNEYGITAYNDITIIGGSVTATSTNGVGIYCDNGVTISGGSVTATGKNFGIHGSNGVSISGGKVTATGYEDGIRSFNGNITLGWTNSTDFIYASSYMSDNGSVQIAEDKSFKDDKDNVYSGTIDDVFDIAGKTLVPPSFNGKFLSDVNIVVADIPVQKYADGKPVCPSVVVTDGKETLTAGTDYTVACFNNTAVTSATLDDAAIAQIIGKGNYAGVIEKRFYIWKNLGDYAAVLIFEDGNGKKHAVIDGEYEGEKTVDIPNGIAVDAVDYIRDFDANTPSTVLLPVRLPSCATVNAKFYKLDYVYQSDYRWVAKVQNIGKALPQANTAYAVMLPTAGKLEFNFEGCATAENKQAIVQTGEIQMSGNTDGSWYFTGTYAFKRWTETENKDEVGLVYGFAGSNEKGIAKGQFGRVDFGAHANPLRCYLRKKDENVTLQTLAKAAPQMLRAASGASYASAYSFNSDYSVSLLPETIDVEFVDDDESGEHTTAIGRMDTRTGKIRLLRTDRTYDLKGRRVNDVKRAAKGAYYGKKF